MPLYTHLGTATRKPVPGGFAPQPTPPTSQVFAAAYLHAPGIGAIRGVAERLFQAPDAGTVTQESLQRYDPLDHVQGYEEHAKEFMWLGTPEAVAFKKSQIDQKRHEDDILARSGKMGVVAALGTGFADPLMWVPILGWAKGASFGYNMARLAGSGAAVGLAFSAAEHLGPVKPLDSPEQDAVENMAGMSLLAVLLGGGAMLRYFKETRGAARLAEARSAMIGEVHIPSRMELDLHAVSAMELTPEDLKNSYGVFDRRGTSELAEAARAERAQALEAERGASVQSSAPERAATEPGFRLPAQDLFRDSEVVPGTWTWDSRAQAGALVARLGPELPPEKASRLRKLLTGEEQPRRTGERGGLTWLASKITPALDIQFNSPSIASLRFFRGLVGTWLTDGATRAGEIADHTAAQDLMRVYRARQGKAHFDVLTSWMKHRGLTPSESHFGIQAQRVKLQAQDALRITRDRLAASRDAIRGDAVRAQERAQNAAAGGEPGLTLEEFGDEVGRVMRDGAEPSVIPEANEAANQVREQFFDWYLEKGRELGIFSDPSEGVADGVWEEITRGDMDPVGEIMHPIAHDPKSYLSQVWSAAAIGEAAHDFQMQLGKFLSEKFALARKAMIVEAKESALKAAKGDLEAIDPKALEAAIKAIEKEIPSGAEEINAIARRMTDRLAGIHEGTDPGALALPKDVVTRSPRLKSVKLDVDATDPLWNQYMESNVLRILDIYERSMAPRIALTEKFGTLDFSEHFDAISRNYERLAANDAKYLVRREGESAEQFAARKARRQSRLTKRHKADRKIMADTLRVLTNTYLVGGGDDLLLRMSYAAKNATNIVMSGGFAVASFPDVGMIGLRVGFTNLWKDSIELLRHDKELFRMEAALADEAVGYYEMVMMSRTGSLMELGGRYASRTKLEKLLARGAEESMLVSGLNPWNHLMKSLSSVAVQARMRRILDRMVAGGELDARDLAEMQRMNITREMGIKIQAQIAEHGKKLEGGQILANVGAWTDEAAHNAWVSGVSRYVDHTILTPGAGDYWALTKSPLVSMMVMYQRFSMAAVEQVMLSTLQESDKQALNGALAMMALGMSVSVFKDLQAGREPNLDPAELVWAGMDRSGLIAEFANLDHYLEVMTANRLGYHAIFGGTPPGGAGDRAFARTLFGPTAGLAKDALTAATMPIQALSQDGVSRADISALQRIMPYRYVVFLQQAYGVTFDEIRKAVGK